MDDQLMDLYHRHVAMAFDRQLRLAEFRERKSPGEKWRHEIETGTMTLGKLTLEAPVLGSRQEHNNSWLWAWSDRNLRLSLTNRAIGDAVRMLVHRLGIHQLGAPGFSLEPFLGAELCERAPDIFGVILAAELGYDGYHLIDRGRTTVLIRDDRLKGTEKNPLSRILTAFPKLLKALPVTDQKAAFLHYAKDYGVAAAVEHNTVKLTGPRGELTATFDDRNRLIRLEGNVQPEKKPVRPAPKKTAARTRPARAAAKMTKKKPATRTLAATLPTRKKPPKPAKKR